MYNSIYNLNILTKHAVKIVMVTYHFKGAVVTPQGFNVAHGYHDPSLEDLTHSRDSLILRVRPDSLADQWRDSNVSHVIELLFC